MWEFMLGGLSSINYGVFPIVGEINMIMLQFKNYFLNFTCVIYGRALEITFIFDFDTFLILEILIGVYIENQDYSPPASLLNPISKDQQSIFKKSQASFK